MGFSIALSLLASALAQEPAGAPPAEVAPAPPPPAEAAEAEPADDELDPAQIASEEIVVWGERVARARAQLDQDLRAYGYRLRRTRDGTAIYGRTGQDRWKPKVLVGSDGVVIFRDPRVVLLPPVVIGEGSQTSVTAPGEVNSPSGQPDRGDISLAFPLKFPSKRIQTQEKGRVIEAIGGDLLEYGRALAGEGEARLLSELPSALDRLWEQGVDRDGRQHADVAARRGALLDLYATRADTPAGRAARGLIEDFVVEVVQSSPTPLTAEEAARARALGMALP